MVSKVFKVIWIISLLAVVSVLFYTYAALGEQVSLGSGLPVISRSGFFYGALAVLTVFNAMSFPVMSMLKTALQQAWFYGLLICLHLFMSSVFIFAGILNSNEKYDYSRLGPAVYGSFALFCIWIVLYPIVLIYQRRLGGGEVS